MPDPMADVLERAGLLEPLPARERFAPLLLALLALLVWAIPLLRPVGFAYDDKEAIVPNPVVNGSLPLSTAFTRDYWHHLEDAGHYRPLATVLLRADHARAGGPEPRTFRWTNVLLHALIVGLVAAAWRRITRTHGSPFPWFGLAVLAVHPAGADVVAWISGRTSLVSGLGAAAGLLGLAYARRGPTFLAICFLGTLISLLGKEDGFVVAALLPFTAVFFQPLDGRPREGLRIALWSGAGSALALGIYALMRNAALGAPFPASPSAPLAHLDTLERVALGLSAWKHGLTELVFFWNPAPPTLPEDSVDGGRAVLVIKWFAILLLAAGLTTHRQRDAASRLALLGLLSLMVCIAPLIQLVPAGELFAPRFLYQPMIFGAFLLHWWFGIVEFLFGRANRGIHVAVIVGMAAVTILQAAPRYANRLTYWESHLPAYDEDARVWNAVGQARQEAGDEERAMEAYARAARLDPGYGAPWSKVGEMRIAEGDLDGAEEAYREAIRRDISAVVPRANLGSVLLRLDRPADAALIYREAIELAPGLAPLHRGLARALLRTGDTDAARASAEEALRLDPADASARRLLERIEGR